MTAPSTPSGEPSRCILAADSSHADPTAADFMELEKQIQELQTQLKEKDRSLSQHEQENQRKTERLRTISDKFHKVQSRLEQVQSERDSLQNALDELETERGDLHGDLRNRTLEVTSLVKRCKLQEEKMAEASLFLAEKTKLQDQLKSQHGQQQRAEQLEQQLTTCREDNTVLKERLDRSQKEHNAVAENLATCLDKLHKLMEEKQQATEDQRLDSLGKRLTVEKERFLHAQTVTQMKEELQRRQDKIDELEGILQESLLRKTTLRRENLELQKKTKEGLATLREHYEGRIASLQQNTQLDAKLNEVQDENRRLRGEMEVYMKEVMTNATTIETLLHERADLEKRAEDADTLKLERSILLEHMAMHDSHFAELACEIAQLESDKDDLIQKNQELQEQVQHYTGCEETIEGLQAEVEAQEHEFKSMERDFLASLATIEEEQDLLGNEIELVLQENRESRQMSQGQISSLENMVASLEEQLEEAKRDALSEEVAMEQLKQELADLKVSADIAESASNLAIEQKNEAIEQLRTKSEHDAHLIESLKAEITTLTNAHERETLSRKVLEDELQVKVFALEQEKISLLHEMQTALEDESLKDQLSSLQTTQDSLQQELQVTRVATSEKDHAIETIQADLLRLKELSAREKSSAEETLAVQKKAIQHLESKCQEDTETIAMLEGNISSLKDVYAEEKQCQELVVQELREKISALQEEESLMRSNLVSSLSETSRTLKNQISLKQALIDALREELKDLQDSLVKKTDTIASIQAEISQVTLASEREAATFEYTIAERNKTIQVLEQKVAAEGQVVHSLKNEVERLKQENEQKSISQESLERQLRDELSLLEQEKARVTNSLNLELKQTSLSLKNEIASKETLVVSLREELESLRDAFSKKDEAIKSMEFDLVELKLESTKEREAARKTRTERDETISSLQTKSNEYNRIISSLSVELAELKRLRLREFLSQRQAIAAKDESISSLTSQLQALEESSRKDLVARDAEIQKLKRDLEKAGATAACLQDEIRDLRVIELGEAGETIASLQGNVLALTEKLASAEQRVVSLEAEVAEWKARAPSAEKLAMLETSLAVQEEEVRKMQAELKEQDTKLQERHKTISTLTEEISTLRQTEITLGQERGRLVSANEELEKEKERLAFALERSKRREKTIKDEADLDSQKRLVGLQKEYAILEARVASQQALQNEVESVLQGRSKLLEQMVAQNKELTSELASERARITELEDLLDGVQQRLATTEEELQRKQKLLREKEDKLVMSLHDERVKRELAEAEISSVKAWIDNKKNEKKNLSQLEKENAMLKDKVKRQEAYLKRKLQRERVLRDRQKNTMTPGRPPLSPKRGSAEKFAARATPEPPTPTHLTTSFFEDWDL